jgi:hypothetical protein
MNLQRGNMKEKEIESITVLDDTVQYRLPFALATVRSLPAE